MSKSLFIFDLFNTLIIDQSFEKCHQYRLDAIWSIIERSGYPIRFSQIIDAYDYCREIMVKNQKEYFSLSIFDQVNIFGNKLNITDITSLKKFYDIWAYASLQFPPILIPHIKEGLTELKYHEKKIALISNTALIPGTTLRFLLKEFEIYDLFDDLVFSDEFGFMKPNTMIFNRVLEHLNTDSKDSVFIGDHELYDKVGAMKAGIDYVYMSPKMDFREIINQALQL